MTCHQNSNMSYQQCNKELTLLFGVLSHYRRNNVNTHCTTRSSLFNIKNIDQQNMLISDHPNCKFKKNCTPVLSLVSWGSHDWNI